MIKITFSQPYVFIGRESLAIKKLLCVWVASIFAFLSARYTQHYRLLTREQVIFPVNADYCIISTCGIFPTFRPSLRPIVLFYGVPFVQKRRSQCTSKSTIFIIYPWYLINIGDIYYISVIFIIYQWYLLYIGDIYYISVIFTIYPWYLLYIGDIYYISVIFIIYQWYLINIHDIKINIHDIYYNISDI